MPDTTIASCGNCGAALRLQVPRLVEGLTIPILVDPRAPERVEIQWHLV